MIPGTLFRQEGTGMYLNKPQVSGIRLQHRFCLDMDTGILEQLEIVLLSVGECQRNDLPSPKADEQLRL